MLLRLWVAIALISFTYAITEIFDYNEAVGDYSSDISFADHRIKRNQEAQWHPTFPPDYEIDDDNKKETTELTYYNMTTLTPDKLDKYYMNMTEWLKNPDVIGQNQHDHLASAYRKAAGFKMRFEFPFYGHKLTNITIATGGFCYVGDQTHSWLAATQYIAPLMANFDTISNDSTIMFGDNGERLVVEWSNVKLRDDQDAGSFTFQLSLFKSGDIWFVYKNIPISANNISDANHPCKIGVSDAYLFNHKVKLFEEATTAQSKRVIHEYHRITVPADKVVSNGVVILKALPTCLQFTTCESCANSTLNYFTCSWCKPKESEAGFCSDEDGLHRKRQEWVEGNCGREKTKICEATTPKPNTATETTTKSGKHHPDAVIPLRPLGELEKSTTTSTGLPKAEEEKSGNGVMTFIVMLMFVVVLAACWVYYAFTNPYSMSGQLLIKYRPSKWRSPASQVRYSASVHM
uniref:Plexin domain-containing protein 2 n=1 Tax=Panagrolaimus sp. ES5 TaxID=591445 RepID=A0AC34F7J7_9BILA